MRLAYLTAASALAFASASICCIDPGAPDTTAGGGGRPPEPTPPTAAASAPEKIHLVWAAPGHPTYAIGMMVRVDGDLGEQLRAAGHARYADADEVKAHRKAKRDIHEFG